MQRETYKWIVRKEAGDGSRSRPSAKRDGHGQLNGINGAYKSKSYSDLQSAFNTCQQQVNGDSSLTLDEKDEQLREQCLAEDVNSAFSRSIELAFGFKASPGFICGIKDAVVNGSKKLPGRCCLDAPFELTGTQWGHEVRTESHGIKSRQVSLTSTL